MNPYVEIKELKKEFKNEKVINEVNLSIPKGQLFGLLGPSGSGKTTLVKMMIGLLEPTGGVIHINGETMPNVKIMENIGYMAQENALYIDLTARQNLEFFAGIYGIPRKKRVERIQKVATMVDLEKELNKPIEKYSGGMMRRISLAIALLHEPELLILDEPTVGIDPVLRASIWQDLQKIQESGTTIIMTTHVMDEAEKCDRLVLLRNGYMIAQGSPTELKQQSGQASLENAFLYYGNQI